MRIHVPSLVLAALCLVTIAGLQAAEPSTPQPKTVMDAYPRLATGALTFARVMTLPEGTLLRAAGVELKVSQVDSLLANQPPEVQEDLRNNAHLVLNQLATREIVLHLAEAQVPEGVPESEAIEKYLQEKVLSRVEVTDAEVAAMYEAEKGMLGGASLAEMQPHIKQYLLEQKKQAAVTEHIRNLGKIVPIGVAESWLAGQAPLARNNPVDKARDSGKPSLVDFGAAGCGPCDMMAPILDDLKVKHQGKLNVVFVNVRERPVLASLYDIQNIPVQAFFDKDGKEIFRHVGFFAQAEIEKKLAEMGVTP